MKNIILALVALLTLSACDKTEKIENGQLPEKYLPYVMEFIGDYSGSVEGEPNVLHVQLEGQHLVLTAGVDLAQSGCDSKIGDLTEISFNEEGGSVKVTGATFNFDPNRCISFEGRVLNVSDWKKDQSGNPTFRISLLEKSQVRRECTIQAGPNGEVREVCRDEINLLYKRGSFLKNL